MNELRDKARFKKALRDLLASFKKRVEPSSPASYTGAPEGDPLEHNTRKHFIDGLLEALQWDLSRFEHQVNEEARVSSKTTIYIDYLGVNPTTRTPRLIVEAKAWSKPLVAPSDRGAKRETDTSRSTAADLVAKAVTHCKNNGSVETSPVIKEWAEWIAKLREYVAGIHKESGFAVPRAAITSGQWLVIFCNPNATFLDKSDASASDIAVLVESEFIGKSDFIFDLIARPALDTDLPFWIRPSALHAYVGATNAKKLFRALWVTRKPDGPYFNVRPQIHVVPAAVVLRADNSCIGILDDKIPHFSLPHKSAKVSEHIDEVKTASDKLLGDVAKELGISVAASDVSEFPGFPRIPVKVGSIDHNSEDETIQLLRSYPTEIDEFFLVTGTHPHFLLKEATVASCPFHEWAHCHSAGQNVGNTPIVSRSVDPASFFYSSEEHHCAHQQIHDRRSKICHVAPFEEYLCCRACALQTVCWANEALQRLPCVSTAASTKSSVIEPKTTRS